MILKLIRQKRLSIILLCVFISCDLAFTQEESFIKSEKKGKNTWHYYQESDTIVKIKVLDKKSRLIHIKRYTDISLSTETGEWIDYYDNQNPWTRSFFDNGEPVGIWYEYNLKGQTKREWNYDFTLQYVDVGIKTKNNSDSLVYRTVDVMPMFHGGDLNDFRMDLFKRLSFTYCMVEKYDGTGINKIKVQFAIDKDGNVVDVKAYDCGKKMLEKDAVRLIRESPKWTPGYKNGQPAKVQFTFPVVYVLP